MNDDVVTSGAEDRKAVWEEHERLAVLARDGDADAMDQLLELIDATGTVRVAVRKVVMNAEAVEDICQDVLILVAERLDRWTGRSRFTTWLHTVSRNKAIDHLRRTRPTVPLKGHLGNEQQRISSLIATRATVRAALEALPPKYRDPVVLRDIDQLDYDEIADRLQLHRDTVRTRVSRARAMVAARLRLG